jgi:hypothetical protein
MGSTASRGAEEGALPQLHCQEGGEEEELLPAEYSRVKRSKAE